ncbi:phosphonopyruvate decarboxylase [Actinokineospora sp.]|uniref:phosphonopyruvate decarboxylase n=1 Tax=Actinokineospora sp. TaxID=1872133 RepID=UPI004037852E
MLAAEQFCHELADRGFDIASGVPCSYFGGPIALLSDIPGRYVPAANEGAALAVAAGAALGGRRCYVMLQNSGLGNLINPLTSLIMTYEISVMVFCSLRGWPDPADDEPQHQVMGPATHALLDVLGVAHWTLQAGDDLARFREILDGADQELVNNRAAFVLVARGAIGAARTVTGSDDRLDSADVVRTVGTVAAGFPVIATTGYTARELFCHAEQPSNFYMQGSMGHASAIGLGVALSNPHRPVVVLDGDGATLMHLGTLSVIGHQAPPNLVHVILDNGQHESTGGQVTTSHTTSFTGVATACGYRTAVDCDSLHTLESALRTGLAEPGPHLLVVRTRPRSGPMPPRATSAATPQILRDRFSQALPLV